MVKTTTERKASEIGQQENWAMEERAKRKRNGKMRHGNKTTCM